MAEDFSTTGLKLISPSQSSVENNLPELKTVLPNADFVIEGYADPREPVRDEGPFRDQSGYPPMMYLIHKMRAQSV